MAAAASPRDVVRATPDEPPPIPFQSLDRLAQVRDQLDNQVVTLLGRLTPYMSRSSTTRVIKDPAGPERLSDSSPLEDRIGDEIAKFQEIAARLEELIGDLRL